TPNWITSTVSWPDYMAPALDYQWNEVAIPWWKAFVAHCEAHGVTQIAIEEFPCMLVYNPATLLRLRAAVGPVVGINLDPSHLIAMGADPIASARALKGAIHHIHGKDARIERGLADINGLLETQPVTAAVEGVLLGLPHGRLRRPRLAGDGGPDDVHRGRRAHLRRRPQADRQRLSPLPPGPSGRADVAWPPGAACKQETSR
ncbi:MAG: hypothetical protein RL223_4083, partial [Pseudomonadota bacterium]